MERSLCVCVCVSPDVVCTHRFYLVADNIYIFTYILDSLPSLCVRLCVCVSVCACVCLCSEFTKDTSFANLKTCSIFALFFL